MEERLEPPNASQVDLLVDSLHLGLDLRFFLSWPQSNIVFSSSTEKDNSELRRETQESREDLEDFMYSDIISDISDSEWGRA